MLRHHFPRLGLGAGALLFARAAAANISVHRQSRGRVCVGSDMVRR